MVDEPDRAASNPRITRPPPEISLPRSHSGVLQGMAPVAAPANMTAPAKAVTEPAICSAREWRPREPSTQSPQMNMIGPAKLQEIPHAANPAWIEDHSRRALNPYA